jgi:hypothetical protein
VNKYTSTSGRVSRNSKAKCASCGTETVNDKVCSQVFDGGKKCAR